LGELNEEIGLDWLGLDGLNAWNGLHELHKLGWIEMGGLNELIELHGCID